VRTGAVGVVVSVLQGVGADPVGSMAARHDVTVTGPADGPVLLFAHGFGCDQRVWRPLVSTFAEHHRCVSFDTIGSGGSDVGSYDARRYTGLEGYAADLLGICAELDLTEVTLVAHSVSAMIAVVAAIEEPQRFRQLVLVAPNPYFLDDDATGYRGGFSAADVAEVEQALDSNYFTWSETMAPVIMGVPEVPELGAELAASFCRTDPDIARALITTSFTTDCRPLLPRVRTPAVVLQCRDDAMVPLPVGDYLQQHLPDATLVRLRARGHCPHISEPVETTRAITEHLLPRP
jgi:sigma-B regulation protein RsbQ